MAKTSSGPELETIRECIEELTIALNELDRKLVHFLHRNGFFTEDLRDEVLNPTSPLTAADKAWKLVERIENRVQQDPESYHSLIGWFECQGNLYQPIAHILSDRYCKHSTPLTADSAHLQQYSCKRN